MNFNRFYTEGYQQGQQSAYTSSSTSLQQLAFKKSFEIAKELSFYEFICSQLLDRIQKEAVPSTIITEK